MTRTYSIWTCIDSICILVSICLSYYVSYIEKEIKMMKEIKLIRKLIDLLIYFMLHECHMSGECKSMRRLFIT